MAMWKKQARRRLLNHNRSEIHKHNRGLEVLSLTDVLQGGSFIRNEEEGTNVGK